MLTRLALFAALVAILALPFALRRDRSAVHADETLVVITPHNEAIRSEFSRAFAAWYRRQTGRTVAIDWRVVGGTSDIARYLEATYAAAFERESRAAGRPWTPAIAHGFQHPDIPVGAPAAVVAARREWLQSNVSSGVDVFFGGDTYQFAKEAAAGRLVPAGVRTTHPDWFTDAVFPESFGGEPLRDPAGRWFGVVLSGYGILYNRDVWRRLGLSQPPEQWTDLGDPRLQGKIGVADPTKSGSVCEAFENVIQQQMQQRLDELAAADPKGDAAELRHRAAEQGWLDGLRIIQRLGANARYFTDSAQKPPLDVAAGDCAAGICIDFYGRQQQESVRQRGGDGRLVYVAPPGGSAVSADPIGVLRGAPHRQLAAAFVAFALSIEGQSLWALKVGTPGGPSHYALRRMPIRRDFYRHSEWLAVRSDPEDNPYAARRPFVYRPEWTGGIFREIGFVTRVVCMDHHDELVAAWHAIAGAPADRQARALAALQDMSAVSYNRVTGELHRRLTARDRADEVRLATELGATFRDQYRRAAAIAAGRD